MTNDTFTHLLQNLMQQVGISSFKALSHAAGVSERQILRLRQGKVAQMRVDILLKLSQVLQISLDELVVRFSKLAPDIVLNQDNQERKRHSVPSNTEQELLQKISELKNEYERSQLALQQQRERLLQEFQQQSLQYLESLLLQWPTAAHKAAENPQLAAIKIVPLVQKPLDKLLQEWGIEAIASVGAELPYDPQFHQSMEGNLQPGERVKVRYIGYRQGDRLLYRAKVSPV
ncbi:nucleotide exchange factor GrpE [Calothrix sp. FACHB-1219]|uniref:nucleotide exchange factor GrpE n=1 Tax=unclassified Calothrix TaxID=2619626 RepID=UPI001687791A|nr:MULTISPECIES: nucleotide exchange factor GrpE [unclassified Calothrix]MBD2206386.1 nucleotide exchange factor GrpE [Calothrix sp. FACHB-168]MBD2219447.1 nucleotide exchange factor GrpE [Calothrix sp. FACHB-1219]